MTPKPESLRCCYCGRFFGFADLEAVKAAWYMVTPDTPFSTETWNGFHVSCHEADMVRQFHESQTAEKAWAERL